MNEHKNYRCPQCGGIVPAGDTVYYVRDRSRPICRVCNIERLRKPVSPPKLTLAMIIVGSAVVMIVIYATALAYMYSTKN